MRIYLLVAVLLVVSISGCAGESDVGIADHNGNYTDDGLEFGIYEVCTDSSECVPEDGIQRAYEAGANAIILSVVDNVRGFGSVALYRSEFLPIADWVSPEYVPEVINLAHERGMKVYAWVNMPHEYWLEMHPEWICVLSDGNDADYYSSDYFQRIVPPSRVVSEEGYLSMMSGIFSEIRSMGFDGIDINDNFQWAEWYFEDSDRTLYSSYDDFSVNMFADETGIYVPIGTARDRASFIEGDDGVYSEWLEWRASKVTLLLSLLDAYADDLPFRPHLLANPWVYEDFGLDYSGISEACDVMYMMADPGYGSEDEYRQVVSWASDAGARDVAASVYIYDEDDVEALSSRVEWLVDEGATSVNVFNYGLIEELGAWDEVSAAFAGLRVQGIKKK